MMLKTASQIHFDHIERGFPDQQRDHVAVSDRELVDLMGSMIAFGVWRLELETGHVFWSEDASRIHGMEPSCGPVSLSRIMESYHPEDAIVVQELLGAASTGQKSFRFVMRVKNNRDGHRLIAVAGRYRPDNGDELIGYCHEYQDMVRAVLIAGE